MTTSPYDDDRRDRPRGVDAALNIAELEAIRLVLRGGSVIDWFRLNFQSDGEVQEFLRVLVVGSFDAEASLYLASLKVAALSYLESEHRYRVPDDVRDASHLDLFLIAGGAKSRRRSRFFACLVLKVIHIVHHIRARELMFRLPLSQSDVAQLLIARVDRFVEELSMDAFPLAAYSGGEKGETSLITKLLVKREHHAAAIHDRVRFRFVVEKPSDIVPLVNQMTRRLVPFNYIVPGESINHLVSFTSLIEGREAYRELASDLQLELGYEDATAGPVNEFSGHGYRTVSFVADVPVRVPSSVPRRQTEEPTSPVIFGLAEFQLVDRDTARSNEDGESRHERYRERQLARTRDRIERGLRGVSLEALEKEKGDAPGPDGVLEEEESDTRPG